MKRRWGDKFLVSAWFGTAATVVVLFAGVLGSVASPEILKLFQVVFLGVPQDSPLSTELLESTGAICLIASLMHFTRQSALDRGRHRAQQTLDESTKRIVKLLETMPPESFISDMRWLLEKATTPDAAAKTIEEKLAAVRATLQAIAIAANRYDDGGMTSVFCANAMVFLSPKEEQFGQWVPRLRFTQDALDPCLLRGLLALSRQLSATQSGPIGREEDQQVREIALGVPENVGGQKKDGNGGFRTLPGAPLAFVDKEVKTYKSTSELGVWCKEQGDFPNYVSAEVDSYFAQSNDQFVGFMSIPITEPSAAVQPREERMPIGVLNIHWKRATKLANSGKAFSEAIFALRLLLSTQVAKLLELGWRPVPHPEAAEEVMTVLPEFTCNEVVENVSPATMLEEKLTPK